MILFARSLLFNSPQARGENTKPVAIPFQVATGFENFAALGS
jgi:hypothetical protein